MLASISWVPKGACNPIPITADPPSKEEIEELIKTGAINYVEDEDDATDEEDECKDKISSVASSEDAGSDVAQARAAAAALGRPPKRDSSFKDITAAMEDLDMDHYDDSDGGSVDLLGNGQGGVYYPSNVLDPFLKNGEDGDDDSEEEDDMRIKSSDGVIVCARNEDEYSHLDVWIYEETENGDYNMYVHHEIVLSEFPLCTAWLDCPLDGGDKGSYVAVGSMGPAIEIWNLDVLDEAQPSVVLGGTVEKKKKKSGKISLKYKKDSHTDSVLGLAWNSQYRNLLASGSADTLVKIWDMTTQQCCITLNHHTDKVQSVAWNPHETQKLLSGSFDHSIVMRDGSAPSQSGLKWQLDADIESLAWDPHNHNFFVASLENGVVQGFDVRMAAESASISRPMFSIHAHNSAVCSVSYNPLIPNLLATGSTDKMVKLWDLSNNQPSCLTSSNRKAGAVFCVAFYSDNPFLLAVGGSKGKLQVWDTSNDSGISRKFGSYIRTNRS